MDTSAEEEVYSMPTETPRGRWMDVMKLFSFSCELVSVEDMKTRFVLCWCLIDCLIEWMAARWRLQGAKPIAAWARTITDRKKRFMVLWKSVDESKRDE